MCDHTSGRFTKREYKNKLIITLVLSLSFMSVPGSIFLPIARAEVQQADMLSVGNVTDLRALGYSGQRKSVMDEEGNMYFAYRKPYGGKNEIFVAKAAKNGSSWSVSGTDKPISLVGKGVDQRVPSIAIDSGGTLHVMWYGADSKEQVNNRQVKYTRSSDGGKTWTRWKNITKVSGYTSDEEYWQEHPMIFAGADDALYAAWEGRDSKYSKQQIKFSRSVDGGDTWSKWKNVKVTSGNTQSRPTVLQDDEGRLHLLMYSSYRSASDTQQIQYAYSDNGGATWSNWKSISNSSFDARHLSAALDSNGGVHVAWRGQSRSGGSARIFYSALRSGNWSIPKAVASSSEYQFFPSICLTAKGTPYIAWSQTAASSEFPRENPSQGKIYLSYLEQDGTFSAAELISNDNTSLYPNMPDKISGSQSVILYETGSAKNYAVKARIVRFE